MNREPHFDENEVLRQCMSSLNEEVPDMPANFHAQWTALVKEDAMKQEETRKVAPMRRWTRILSVAAALVFVVGGTLLTKDSLSPARTSSPQSLADSYDYDYDTYTSDVGYSEEAGSGARTMMVRAANDAMPETASAKSAVAEDKKIIRNVSLTIKTSAYDDSMASLTALLAQYGGYLESSSEYTNSRDLRTASLTLRIPADSLDAFLSGTGAGAHHQPEHVVHRRDGQLSGYRRTPRKSEAAAGAFAGADRHGGRFVGFAGAGDAAGGHAVQHRAAGKHLGGH